MNLKVLMGCTGNGLILMHMLEFCFLKLDHTKNNQLMANFMQNIFSVL